MAYAGLASFIRVIEKLYRAYSRVLANTIG